MSIRVELDELRAVAAEQAPFAYLLTVSDDATRARGRDHARASATARSRAKRATAAARTRPRARTCRCCGRRRGPTTTRSSSTGRGRRRLHRPIAPERAVRHRPAPGGGSDCAPVALTRDE